METISFILGIASVVVIAIAIVAVYAFVKVRNQKEEIKQIYRSIHQVENQLYRTIDDTVKEYQSQYSHMISITDSRFDKLENRIKEKQLIKG
jgi:conjugal transfer/entry exclusion protein